MPDAGAERPLDPVGPPVDPAQQREPAHAPELLEQARCERPVERVEHGTALERGQGGEHRRVGGRLEDEREDDEDQRADHARPRRETPPAAPHGNEDDGQGERGQSGRPHADQ